MTSQTRANAFDQSEPLALSNTWPLWERSRHFELGHVLSSLVTDSIEPTKIGELSPHHAGCWECDLSNDSLTWSGGVYDIFGVARSTSITRARAVAFYCEESRAKMERLRTYSIKHRRGFTLDVEIRTDLGEQRWMRLIAAPVCIEGRVSALHGLKLVI
jgi:PAS domain-containing protein